MTVQRIGTPPVLPNGAKVPLFPATRVGDLIFYSGGHCQNKPPCRGAY